MIDKLTDYFRRSSESTKDKTPDGLCPNCWGTQEYDKKIRILYKDKQIDVNNHKANYAFIQKFVIKYISGIRLKKGNNGYECPSCKSVTEY